MKKIVVPGLLIPALALCAASSLSAATGQEIWAKNCAACHGADGAGHTKAGRMKGVKDMTNPDYQKGFTDEQAMKQIKEGFKDKNGNEKMKAFGGALSDDDVKALTAYVRSFKK